MNQLLENALAYISNAGGSPQIDWFDDDHEPIGPKLRADMVRMGLARETGQNIQLTDEGKKILPAGHG